MASTTISPPEEWTESYPGDAVLMGSLDGNEPPFESMPMLDIQPVLFLENMVIQVQLLSCLKWFGEYQVLTLIPLRGSISAEEVAELAGVPVAHLSRIVRMAAAAGFLHEPQPGQIAHTPLSAPFVTSYSLLDAAMFLAESAAPTALQMASKTIRSDDDKSGDAFSKAVGLGSSFANACATHPRLQRQWAAYQLCAASDNEPFVEVLKRLNWRSMGCATIVDIAAQGTEDAITLSQLHPSLRFVVQLLQSSDLTSPNNTDCETAAAAAASNTNNNIVIQTRTPASPQQVQDASVYILNPQTLSGLSLAQRLQAELSAHLPILRNNTAASMILAPSLLPEPATVSPQMEIRARVRDLHRMQLTSESDMELSELVHLVSEIRDDVGGLVVVNKIPYSNGMVAAVSVKYKYRRDRMPSTSR